MRDIDPCNRAILTVFLFQGVENDLVDPHGCIVLSVSVRMSVSFKILYLVRVQQGRGTSLATHFPLNSYSPSMNRKHGK